MLARCISAFLALLLSLLNLTGGTPAPVSEPKVSGSFIQSWYCAGWTDERWDEETAWMKEAGLEYLILQSVAVMDKNGGWRVYYPSAAEDFINASFAGDALTGALRSCKKAGIKLFVGLAEFDGWWDGAGFSPDYSPVCSVMAHMQKEIYDRYMPEYAGTLRGWYFPPEIDNVLGMKLGIDRIAEGLNTVLDAATALDPAMPVMLSPYFSEKYTVPSVLATLPMWERFFAKARFRDGDIFCPQDAVGAGWTREEHLEKVWKMYRSAVQSAGVKVRLWANCENFTSTDSGNVPAPMERFARQLDAASRCAETIVAFSMNHFYSPYTDAEAYEAYLEYQIKNKK